MSFFSLSPIGLLLPNILFIIFFLPENIPIKTKSTPWIFVFLERIGQVGWLILLPISTNQANEIDRWLILSFLFLLLYYLLWLR